LYFRKNTEQARISLA